MTKNNPGINLEEFTRLYGPAIMEARKKDREMISENETEQQASRRRERERERSAQKPDGSGWATGDAIKSKLITGNGCTDNPKTRTLHLPIEDPTKTLIPHIAIILPFPDSNTRICWDSCATPIKTLTDVLTLCGGTIDDKLYLCRGCFEAQSGVWPKFEPPFAEFIKVHCDEASSVDPCDKLLFETDLTGPIYCGDTLRSDHFFCQDCWDKRSQDDVELGFHAIDLMTTVPSNAFCQKPLRIPKFKHDMGTINCGHSFDEHRFCCDGCYEKLRKPELKRITQLFLEKLLFDFDDWWEKHELDEHS